MAREGSPAQEGSGPQARGGRTPKRKSVEPYSEVPPNLYDDGSLGLCYLDMELRYLHINKSLAAINGLTVKEHVGRSIGEVLPDLARAIEKELRQVIATGEPIEAVTVDATAPAPSGIMRTLQYNFYPVRSPDGAVVGASCAVQDTTKQEQLTPPTASASPSPPAQSASPAAADAGDTTDQRRIAAQLAQSAAALEAANRKLEAFHEALTHDLRGPLSIVTNCSHQLYESLGDSLGEQAAEDLEQIRGAGRQMMQIIDDLRDLGDVKRVEIGREEVDFSKMGRAIIADLEAMAPNRRVTFEAEDGIKAFGDRSLLKILLSNLLQNAWKYTEPHEDAWIELGVVEDEEDGPIYHVRDNGIGFDNADSEVIFQVFKRLHTGAEFSGSGLGLATVMQIVRRHGGEVWADGLPGEGAVFRFTLGSSRD